MPRKSKLQKRKAMAQWITGLALKVPPRWFLIWNLEKLSVLGLTDADAVLA